MFIFFQSTRVSRSASSRAREKKAAVIDKTACRDKIRKLIGGRTKRKKKIGNSTPRGKRQSIRPSPPARFVRPSRSSICTILERHPGKFRGDIPFVSLTRFTLVREIPAATSCCFSFTAFGCFPF